jgi:hypothetical protein
MNSFDGDILVFADGREEYLVLVIVAGGLEVDLVVDMMVHAQELYRQAGLRTS